MIREEFKSLLLCWTQWEQDSALTLTFLEIQSRKNKKLNKNPKKKKKKTDVKS